MRDNASNWLELASKVWNYRRDRLNARESDELVSRTKELNHGCTLPIWRGMCCQAHRPGQFLQARPLSGTRQLQPLSRKPSANTAPTTPLRRPSRPCALPSTARWVKGDPAVPSNGGAGTCSGWRLAIISFHSLQTAGKKFFRLESRDCICPPRQPVCTCGHKASILEITRRPITPTGEEIESNSRSRSAKLRVAEKLKVCKPMGVG